MVPESMPRRYFLPALAFGVVTYALLLAPPEQIAKFAGREQLIEQAGAAFLLAASFVCFLGTSRAGLEHAFPSTYRRVALLGLGIFFFIAFGEEISWGQHLFGFQAPEALARYNIQEEVNLHNLRVLDTFSVDGEKKTGLGLLFNSNRLFDYFMVILFLLFPLLTAHSSRMRSRLELLGLPPLPQSVSVLLVLNLLASLVAELFLVRGHYTVHLAVSEIRESNYALLCFIAPLYWVLPTASSASSPT